MYLKLSRRNLTSIKDIPENEQDSWVTRLDISWNNLTNLEGIERYPRLISLQCMGSGISSFQGIQGCPEVRKITAMGNNLKNLKGLENSRHLFRLHVDNNPSLESLQGIESCQELEVLDCYNCNLTNLQGLEDCAKLRSLSCHSNPLIDYSSLKHVPEKLIYALS